MADYIDRFTDEEEQKYAKQLRKVYGQAAKDVRRELAKFQQRHNAKSAELLQQVQAGKITMQDYKAWLRGQVFQGAQWQQKLKSITSVYVDADKKARQMLGGTMQNVFTESANYTAFEIEKGFNGGVSFQLYDHSTVQRLIREKPQMLPKWKIHEKKDYVWNRQRVENTITQGIIQGRSIDAIAESLCGELSTSNAGKMRLFARTAMTGAQNAGRVERMQEADEQYGIKSQKQWLSCGDKLVRDTHIALNGVTVDYDKPFIVPHDGRKINYPGDPTAEPDLVYNCRCTLIYIQPHSAKYDYTVQGHRLPEYDSYQRWRRGKDTGQPEETAKPEAPPKPKVNYGEAVSGIDDDATRAAITQKIDDAPEFAQRAWNDTSGTMSAPVFDGTPDSKAYFSPTDKKTHYISREKAFGRSDYQEEHAVYFHEYGHNIDYQLGGGNGYFLSETYNNGEFGQTLRQEIEERMLAYYQSKHPRSRIILSTPEERNLTIAKSFIETPGIKRSIRSVLRSLESNGTIGSANDIFDTIIRAQGDGDYGLIQSLYQKYLANNSGMQWQWQWHADRYVDPAIARIMTPANIRGFCQRVCDSLSIYERSDISDMFDGYFSQYGVEYGMGVGHGAKYFRRKANLPIEAFAEMYSATMVDGVSLPVIKRFFPKSYGVFEQMLGGR